MKCIFPKLPILVSVVLALLCNFVAFAQFPPIQWQHCYGGSDRDAATAVIPLGDTGFIFAGTAASYNGDRISTFWGGDDFWLVNIDNYGSIKWEKSHGGNFFEACTAITATNSGYLLAGETNSVFGEVSGLHGDLTNPQQDCWIVATDKSGDLLWQKCFGGSKMDFCYSMINTDDGNHIFAGRATSNDGDLASYTGFGAAWVLKFNDTGGIIWQKVFDTSDAQSIYQTSDHSYLIAGCSNVSATGPGHKLDLWLQKINDTGGIVWQRFFGGTEYDYGKKVIQTKDGGSIIAGYTNSVNGDISGNHGGYDLWVLKVTSTGSKQWSKVYGGSGDDQATSIIQTFDGGYLVSGYTNSTDGDITANRGANDMWLLKLDASGSIQWQKTYGGSQNDYAGVTCQTADSGFIISGSSYSNDGSVSGNHGSIDCWILRLDKDGVAVPAIKPEPAISVYPNPASNELHFSLPQSTGNATIKLATLEGQQLDEQCVNYGSTASFDVANYLPGVYTYTTVINGKIQHGKFTIKR